MTVSLGYCEYCFTLGNCSKGDNSSSTISMDAKRKWILSARKNLEERDEVKGLD